MNHFYIKFIQFLEEIEATTPTLTYTKEGWSWINRWFRQIFQWCKKKGTNRTITVCIFPIQLNLTNSALSTISERFSGLVSGDGFKVPFHSQSINELYFSIQCARFGATFISPSNEIHCKNDEDSSESKTKPSTE